MRATREGTGAKKGSSIVLEVSFTKASLDFEE